MYVIVCINHVYVKCDTSFSSKRLPLKNDRTQLQALSGKSKHFDAKETPGYVNCRHLDVEAIN